MEDLMNWLKTFTPLFHLVIAVSAFLAVAYLLFQLALSPIKEQVSNHIPTQINELKKAGQERDKAGKERDKKIDRIENKLDRLLNEGR